jgi:hypothetical protein
MKQAFHIFRKDVRHYWLEIAASLALMAAFGRFEVRGWWGEQGSVAGGFGFFGRDFWPGTVTALVPVAWFFLVIRAVQGESLVGDRQFWVTRPYEWPKLLGSKIAFVLAFVCVPLLVLQIVLLRSAGFHPTNYGAGLLWMQLTLLMIILPMAALATVTATVVQLLLALLIVVLYLIGMSWLSSQFHNSFGFRDVTDQLSEVLFFGTGVAVVLLQYARRATTKSRSLIAALGVVMLLMMVASPYEFFLARAYPELRPGEPVPFRLGLLAAEKPPESGPGADEKEIQFRVPFSVSGVQPDAIVNLAGVRVSMDAADGSHWNSGWKSFAREVFPEQTATEIDFSMKRDEFLRMQSSPVNVRIAVAYTLYRDGDKRQVVIPGGTFRLTEVGWCSAQEMFRKIQCLAPMRKPDSLLITSELSAGTCPVLEQDTPAKPGEMARGWIQGDPSAPAEFGISPVKSVDLYVTISNRIRGWGSMGLCPGTPVVLSHPVSVASNRTEMQFPGVQLGTYRQAPIRFSHVSVGLRSK